MALSGHRANSREVRENGRVRTSKDRVAAIGAGIMEPDGAYRIVDARKGVGLSA